MSIDPARTDVFAEERQQLIARLVEEHGRARVTDLSARFGVSSVTIRKDLEKLELQGRLMRTHGGAVAVGRASAERGFDVRERLQRIEKDTIGREAAAMVVDGESIALDASTTALALARHLKARGGWLHLTVITNGLRIATELAGHPGITVAMPGGFLRWEALSLVGPLGEGLFDKVNIQTAFMGAAGFALDAGLSDATEEEAQIKRLMVQGASRTVALVDHTKWGRAAFATFCRTADLGAVVTDTQAPAGMLDAIRGLGIDVHLATAGADGAAAGTLAAGQQPCRRSDPVVAPVVIEGDGASPATRSLALRGVSKSFGPTLAVSDVSLQVRAGEVHALVGENGAGKSTLVKIIGGVHQPDEGTILLDGSPIVLQGPAHARALGIAVVHQEPRLFPDLTVAENVFIGHAPTGVLRSIDWGAMRRQAQALFDELGVRFDVQAPVRGLSMADQQLIEIAKALSVDARVLILDEPTASLSSHEVQRLFAIVRGLRDRGVGILFVSHRLAEVFDLCDTATVLRDGKHVITLPTRDLTTADLIRHMVGRAVTLFPKADTVVGDVLLEVEGLSRAGEFDDVSFAVRAGEIVGMAGLVGAGRTEVARVLFGIDRRDAGEVRVGGRAAHFATPSEAMNAGIAYIPEDRHQQGLVLDFSIAENVTLPILTRLFRRLLVVRATEREVARSVTDQFRVRMTGVDQVVSALSGGNQQKVVLAKWLASKPSVLILDEPTRGIDIGAKVEVHRIISELAAQGLAILLISSDLPEVLAMSDRILVLHEGRITAEIPRDRATEEAVMYAATGNVQADPAPVPAEGASGG